MRVAGTVIDSGDGWSTISYTDTRKESEKSQKKTPVNLNFEKMMEERQKRLQEEIEIEKKKIMSPAAELVKEPPKELPFENRIYNRRRQSILDTYDKRNIRTSPDISPQMTHMPITTEVIEMNLDTAKNEIVIPNNPLFQEDIAIQIDTTIENEHHK